MKQKHKIQSKLKARLSNRLFGTLSLCGLLFASLYFFLQTSSDKQSQNTFILHKAELPATSIKKGRASVKIEEIDKELSDLTFDKNQPEKYKERKAFLESRWKTWKQIEDIELKISLRPQGNENTQLIERINELETLLYELPNN